jgi:hypothetical protein
MLKTGADTLAAADAPTFHNASRTWTTLVLIAAPNSTTEEYPHSVAISPLMSPSHFSTAPT